MAKIFRIQTGFLMMTKDFYINAPAVILPTNNKALLCLLNSKLAWYFFKDICVIRSGGFIEMETAVFLNNFL